MQSYSNNTKGQDLFFELLLIAAGARKQLSQDYSSQEWEKAFSIAVDQSMAGVLMSALELLQQKGAQLPSKEFLLQWIGIVQMTEQNTKRLSEASKETVNFFRSNGFACNILKGVSVGRYYPEPLRRSSGDVDIWLAGGRKKIYDFAKIMNYHALIKAL